MLYWIMLGDVENMIASSLHPSAIKTRHGGMWLSRKSPVLALDNYINGNIGTQSRIQFTLLDKTLSVVELRALSIHLNRYFLPELLILRININESMMLNLYAL
jgi:hypothetical protein